MPTASYQTKDMSQIVVLLAIRFRLESVERDKEKNVCWFKFKKTNQLQKTMEEFMDGTLMVNARDITDSYRRAKELIYAARPENGSVE